MITAVYAKDLNGGIGYRNGLPWIKLVPDMSRFMSVTKGKVVIMGRKTWESISDVETARALPGRVNVIVSRQSEYCVCGGQLFGSLDAALVAHASSDICIIGGAELYLQTLPLANEVYETVVCGQFPSDVYLEPMEPGRWILIDQVVRPADQKSPYLLYFNHYRQGPDWLSEAKGRKE